MIMENVIEYDVPCYYCYNKKTKMLYNLKTGDWETNWYFCCNCGRHIFVKPEIEKVYA